METTNPYGYDTCYEYDSLDRITRIDYGSGYSVLYSYYGNSSNYRTTTYMNEDGMKTVYEYFEDGRMKLITEWDGSTTTYTYDVLKRLTRTDGADGAYSLRVYDGDSYRTLTYEERYSDGRSYSYLYTYYAGSNYTKSYVYTDTDGNVYTYEYTSTGRLDKITYPDGKTAKYSYDPTGRTSRINYSKGEISYSTYEYYNNGYIKKQSDCYADGTISYDEYSYYASVNYSWNYKTYKRVERNGDFVLYEYNDKYQLTRVTRGNGDTTTLTELHIYDAMGRQARVEYSNGAYDEYTYSGTGWMLERIDRYNASGKHSYEAYAYFSDVFGMNNTSTYTIGYEDGTTRTFFYDAFGVTLKELLPDGRTAYYSKYDDQGFIVRKDISDGTYELLSEYWDSGQAKFVRDYNAQGVLLATYEYDNDGKLIKRTYEYNDDKLPGNYFGDCFPFINDDGQIVWTANAPGYFTSQVFFYDGSDVMQLTNDSNVNYFATLNNEGQVVWCGQGANGKEIFFYDGSSVVKLTDNAYDDMIPQLNDKGHIVWWGPNDGSDDEKVYFYNGTDTIELFNGEYPQINENDLVVWHARSPGGNSEIYMYDGTDITELTNSGYENIQPRVNKNGYVVWQGQSGGKSDIFLYDGSDIIKLTDGPGENGQARINENGYVVWKGHDGADYEIYLYDGSVVWQLTDNSFDDSNPEINNKGQVTWEGDGKIYLYDGFSIRVIGSGKNPQINDKGSVTWTENNEIHVASPAVLGKNSESGMSSQLATNKPDGVLGSDELPQILQVSDMVAKQFKDHFSRTPAARKVIDARTAGSAG